MFRPFCEYSQCWNTLSNMVSNTWKYEVYSDRLCTVSSIIRPIVGHKSVSDGPTSGSWSKLLSLGTTRIRSTGRISGNMCCERGVRSANTLSISMFCLFYPERQETCTLREYMLCMLCWTLHKVSCRNLDLSRNFLYFSVDAASILNGSSRVTCSGSISAYPYTLSSINIVVVMIPHYFHKQRYIQ